MPRIPLHFLAAPGFIIVMGALSYCGTPTTTAMQKGEIPMQEISMDAQVLESLSKAGSNLDKPHDIDFFFFLSSEKAAEDLAERLNAENYFTEINPIETDDIYAVQATISMVPKEADLVSLREKFNAWMVELSGEYDGWGTSVVK